MKSQVFFVLAVLLTISGSLNANVEKVVDIVPKTLYVPVGFDDNDDVSVVLDGYLPSTCHRVRQPDLSINQGTRVILLQPRAIELDGNCINVTVPYTTVVNLGTLPEGKYQIQTRDGVFQESLEVKHSKSGTIDEFLYAPIDSLEIRNHEVVNFSAVLKGRFTNTCLRIQEIKVFNSGKTVEILPIMKNLEKTESGAPCLDKESPFEQVVALPQLKAGRHLVHVRSLNGQSLNAVFTNLWQ